MVVDAIIELLRDLVPLWLLLLVLGFGYLLVLLSKVSRKFIELGERQAEFLSQRFDAVDKSTTIFTRTIEVQEKEIAALRRNLESVSSQVEAGRASGNTQAQEELRVLAGMVEDLSKNQTQILKLVSSSRQSEARSAIRQVKTRKQNIDRALQMEIPRAIEARERSKYAIEVNDLEGVMEVVRDMVREGLPAAAYVSDLHVDDSRDPKEHQAIWVGTKVAPQVVAKAVEIARKRWPFLRYVELSSDYAAPPPHVHSQLFIGGSTETATRHGLSEWTEADFDRLKTFSAVDTLHRYVRSKYTKPL